MQVLPIFIGFGLTVLYTYLISHKVVFEQSFFVQWLSAVSLSLAIYAFWEKFVPSEKKILTEAEIQANKVVIEELKNKLAGTADVSDTLVIKEQVTETVAQTEAGQAMERRKIILTNNKK